MIGAILAIVAGMTVGGAILNALNGVAGNDSRPPALLPRRQSREKSKAEVVDEPHPGRGSNVNMKVTRFESPAALRAEIKRGEARRAALTEEIKRLGSESLGLNALLEQLESRRRAVNLELSDYDGARDKAKAQFARVERDIAAASMARGVALNRLQWWTSGALVAAVSTMLGIGAVLLGRTAAFASVAFVTGVTLGVAGVLGLIVERGRHASLIRLQKGLERDRYEVQRRIADLSGRCGEAANELVLVQGEVAAGRKQLACVGSALGAQREELACLIKRQAMLQASIAALRDRRREDARRLQGERLEKQRSRRAAAQAERLSRFNTARDAIVWVRHFQPQLDAYVAAHWPDILRDREAAIGRFHDPDSLIGTAEKCEVLAGWFLRCFPAEAAYLLSPVERSTETLSQMLRTFHGRELEHMVPRAIAIGSQRLIEAQQAPAASGVLAPPPTAPADRLGEFRAALEDLRDFPAAEALLDEDYAAYERHVRERVPLLSEDEIQRALDKYRGNQQKLKEEWASAKDLVA